MNINRKLARETSNSKLQRTFDTKNAKSAMPVPSSRAANKMRNHADQLTERVRASNHQQAIDRDDYSRSLAQIKHTRLSPQYRKFAQRPENSNQTLLTRHRHDSMGEIQLNFQGFGAPTSGSMEFAPNSNANSKGKGIAETATSDRRLGGLPLAHKTSHASLSRSPRSKPQTESRPYLATLPEMKNLTNASFLVSSKIQKKLSKRQL